MPRHPKPWFRSERKAWFVTIAGVQHNLGPNKSEAHEQFHQLMRQPTQKKVSALSIPAIADAFLEWVKRNRSAETFDWYRTRLQRFIRRVPNLSVQALKPLHVEEWASEKIRSINTRRNLMRAVKRCFRWAYAQGYLDRNPLEHLEIPSAEPKEVYISPAEFSELLENVSNDEFKQLLVVTYQVGCRPQESLRLEARHVDLENSRWIFPKAESKGKKSPRIVYLSEQALSITSDLVKKYPQGKLFRNQQGNPWTPSSVGCQFTRLQYKMGKRKLEFDGGVNDADIQKLAKNLPCEKKCRGKLVKKTAAELREEAKRKTIAILAKKYAPRYSLYSLRHSWATNALQTEGMDALTVAVLMGHKDPSTLARTYQHLSHNPQHMLEQAKKAAG